MTKIQLATIIECIEAIAEEVYMRMDNRDWAYHDSSDYKKQLFSSFGFSEEEYYTYYNEED